MRRPKTNNGGWKLTDTRPNKAEEDAPPNPNSFCVDQIDENGYPIPYRRVRYSSREKAIAYAQDLVNQGIRADVVKEVAFSYRRVL